MGMTGLDSVVGGAVVPLKRVRLRVVWEDRLVKV